MAELVRRKNAELLGWLRAAAIAASTWLGMGAMQVRPYWLVVAVALGAGLTSLANVEVGVLVALVGLCLPIVAANPIVGLCAVVLLFVTEHYLGGRNGTGFLLIALAVFGAFFGPVWAAAALAGCLLGSAEGAVAAAAACIAVEVIGIFLGRSAVTVITTGGPTPAIISFAHAPATLLSSAWIGSGFKSLSAKSVNHLSASLGHVGHPPVLLAQIGVWVLGAVVAGMIVKRGGTRPSLVTMLAAAGAGVATIAAGDAVTRVLLGLPFASGAQLLALGSSLVVALGVIAVRETVFATVPIPTAEPTRVSMAAEDADVDELLRLIATAEDKLASQHTSERVVLITDMKSFSRMTEEDGSVATAKAIQRHRDLLVPIIQRNHGCGKSTGGDGVVAAFESAADGVRAAVEGQQALHDFNASHPNEREIWVRMGLASGEVVLDNGGRPFIGAALNLAARVMNLADGGQVFATGDVMAAAAVPGAPATHSFGTFELKNIANPVEVGEVMWAEGQQPHDPRAEQPAE